MVHEKPKKNVEDLSAEEALELMKSGKKVKLASPPKRDNMTLFTLRLDYDTIGELQDQRIPLMHGFTYMNHPVACAAGLANIAVLEEEGLVEKAAKNGAYLLEQLQKLRKYDSVGDVRGMGMLAAIELVADKETKTPIQPENSAPDLLVELCWEKGVYIRSSTMETVCIAPALIIDRPTIDKIVKVIEQSIPEMEKQLLKK